MLIDIIDIDHIIKMLPLKDLSDKGSYYLSCCPFHDDKSPSFSVVKETDGKKYKGNYKCWSCGESGSLNTLCKKLLGKSLYKLLGYDYKSLLFVNSLNKINNSSTIHKHFEHKLNDLKLLYSRINDIGTDDYNLYLKRRCIDNDSLLDYFQIKYVNKVYINNTPFVNRLLIPVFYDGELVNIEGRLITDNINYNDKSIPKVIYPKGCKTDILFNYDDLDFKQPLIVTEGVLDCLRLWSFGYTNSTSIFGTAIKQNQIELLKEFDTIIFMLDNDEAGFNALKRFESELDSEYYIAALKQLDSIRGRMKIDPNNATLNEIQYALNNKITSSEYWLKYFNMITDKKPVNW